MGLREEKRSGADTAVTDPPAAPVRGSTEEYDGSTEQLLAEIEALSESNRRSRSLEIELRLLRLRHVAAMRRVDDAAPSPGTPSPTGPGCRSHTPYRTSPRPTSPRS
jgi:hypothetical protein